MALPRESFILRKNLTFNLAIIIMDVKLPEDLEIKNNEKEEFQYCPNTLESDTLLPISIDNIRGKLYIEEYCLEYPPEWGEVKECKKIKKNPLKLSLQTSSEIVISILLPEIEGSKGLFGLKIFDEKTVWNTRFKIISPGQYDIEESTEVKSQERDEVYG